MWSASACVSALLGPGMFDCLSKAVCSPRWQAVSVPSGCPAASCIADILGCPILPCNFHAEAHMGLGQGHGACLQYVEGASHVPTPQGHKRIHAALLKLHTACRPSCHVGLQASGVRIVWEGFGVHGCTELPRGAHGGIRAKNS